MYIRLYYMMSICLNFSSVQLYVIVCRNLIQSEIVKGKEGKYVATMATKILRLFRKFVKRGEKIYVATMATNFTPGLGVMLCMLVFEEKVGLKVG